MNSKHPFAWVRGNHRRVLRVVQDRRPGTWTSRLRSRRERPWLGMVGVPLAMIAVSLAGMWWAWLPLTGCAWWWSPRQSHWKALLAVQAGVVGAEWAYIGASALAAFPHQRLTVGILWIGAAVLVASVAAVNRRRANDG